jgi:hypothetical protein
MITTVLKTAIFAAGSVSTLTGTAAFAETTSLSRAESIRILDTPMYAAKLNADAAGWPLHVAATRLAFRPTAKTLLLDSGFDQLSGMCFVESVNLGL